MSSADEELWLAFQEEVGEQLDNLDMELLRGVAQCDIHQVFRDFHTIKSSCAMLDLTSMKELAHISEDYLDLVRKGSASFSEAGLDALLSSVETLKQQLALSVATRSNPEPASDLLQVLQQLVVASGAGSATRTGSTATGEVHAGAVAAAAGPDPEFVELALSCAKAMDLLSAATALDAPLKNALIEMANMADLMDFPVIKALGRDIIKTLGHADTHDSDLRLLHDQAELLERIRLLEDLHAVDCASRAAEEQWRSTYRKPFLKAVLALQAALEEAGRAASDPERLAVCCDNIAVLLDRLAAYASLCGFPELGGLLRYVAQVVRSIRRGYFEASPAVFAALGHAVDHPYVVMLEEGEAALVNEIAAAFRQLERAVTSGMREEPARAAAAVVAPAVHDRFRLGLDAAGHALLGQALANGRVLLEIDLDMTSESPVVEELLEWISQNGTILHNISSFADTGAGEAAADQIHIVFLVAFDQPLAAVREELLAIDTQAGYFNIREHQSGHEPAESAEESTHAPAGVAVAAGGNVAESVRLTSATMRVDSHVLDELVTELGEIVMLRNMIGTIVSREKFDAVQKRSRQLLDKLRHAQVTAAELEELKQCVLTLHAYRDALQEADQKMQVSMGQVQQKVLDLREMPLSTVFNRLPNIARKQAQAGGKKVELKTTGADVRIDKGMVELLLEPLVQLVCNAIEHGIETPDRRQQAGKPAQGLIQVAAAVDNGLLQITVTDDGAGVNLAALQDKSAPLQQAGADDELARLVFERGLSTASDSALRGNGLADMRQLLGRIGGRIDLHQQPGIGAVFTLRLPQSVAMQDMLLVRSGRGLSALPARYVAATMTVSPSSLQTLNGKPALPYQDTLLPVAALDMLLDQTVHTSLLPSATALPVDEQGELHVVVLVSGAGRLAVAVRQLAGIREVFVPELHPALAEVGHVAGVTILGDGSLVYILNTEYLQETFHRRAHASQGLQAGSAVN